MSLTTLDPKTALVVIDLQKGIAVVAAGGPPGRKEYSHGNLQFPPDWTDLLPALGQQPQDHLVTKHTWGAFAGTGLAALLIAEGVTQIVLCGVTTSIGVESTAREAHSLGFNVTLAVDAMTDLSAEAHANSLQRIFPRLGESGNTQDIIDLLDSLDRGQA